MWSDPSSRSPAGSYYKVSTTAASSSQYLRAPNASALSTYDVTWDDPMADMILMANELAFRTAVTTSTLAPGGVSILATLHHSKADWWNLTSEQPYVISPNLTSVQRAVEQTALVTASMPVAVYVTHRGWLAGGFTVMCVACLAIAPTYWGWWRLGRKVSMSPLEIARAFDAPVLREAPHNATGDDVKKILGPKRVNLAPASAGGTQEERIALTQHNPKMDGETTITR